MALGLRDEDVKYGETDRVRLFVEWADANAGALTSQELLAMRLHRLECQLNRIGIRLAWNGEDYVDWKKDEA